MFQLEIDYRARVWGGQRLRPGPEPIGEAWVVHEGNRILAGPLAGRTLAEAAADLGPALVGSIPFARAGARFPLLIKILDCQDWLSVQVHPDDAQATRMAGPGQFGKTEAWHILEAAPGARIIAGVRAGTSARGLAEAIQGGKVLDVAEWRDVGRGDTVFMPAGTLHALGPGLLVYEVQQASDITYRVWDWDRPAAAGRALHVAQSVAVTNPAAAAILRPAGAVPTGTWAELTRCPYFIVEARDIVDTPCPCDTQGVSFHAVTATEGSLAVSRASESIVLSRFETALIPASDGAYTLRGAPRARVLLARVGP